jgi:hypothetical protein
LQTREAYDKLYKEAKEFKGIEIEEYFNKYNSIT